MSCAEEGYACQYDSKTGICRECGEDMISEMQASQDTADQFAAMMAEVAIETPDETQPFDFTALSLQELLDARIEIERVLSEHGALLHPETDEDQDLQTRYYGLSMELQRRQGDART